MSLLFVAAKLSNDDWHGVPFNSRVELIKNHYIARVNWSGIRERTWFFPNSGIGIYVAYQQQPRKNFVHESTDGPRTDFISHPPYGCTLLTPGVGAQDIPSALARAVERDEDALLSLSPAQLIISVDEQRCSFSLHNDFLGLSKSYLLTVPQGTVLASRPIAAHLMAARKPVVSSLGWASQQLHGWFLSHLTPFQDTRELLGGTRIVISEDGIKERRKLQVGKLFLEPPSRSMFDGFERYLSEFQSFSDSDTLDIALSGGRDSRAAASMFLHYFSDIACLRTNEPPNLEGIIARRLVERLPNFRSFNQDRTRAFNANGGMIWKANNPKVSEVDVYTRAAQWTYVGEGLNLPNAIYGVPPAGPVFSNTTDFIPSIAGVAGEAAKAYYWSPNMVSGAYARSLKTFREDIKAVHISQRLRTHPLTTQSLDRIVAEEYRQPLLQMVFDAQREATGLGIHGYRFLDYWWLTNRFAVASTLFGSSFVMPFMVPEFLATALQRSPAERAQGQILTEIVSRFVPQWADVEYFDQLQNTVPREDVRTYRERSLLWEGEIAKDFFDILADSPAFDDPFNREQAVALFSKNIETPQKQAMNIRALSLVHRHATWELCNRVGEDVSRVRRGAAEGKP